MQCYGRRAMIRMMMVAAAEKEEEMGGEEAAAPLEAIERLANESAVVVFSVSTCCMCHVVKSLLGGLGVNAAVYELDELEGVGGRQLREALAGLVVGHGAPPTPAVFIGGKLVGGLDHVMAAHISGALVPLLKDAGALWL